MADLPNFKGSPKPVLSASSIGKYRRCGRAAHYRYVTRPVRRQQSQSAAFGSAIHATLDYHLEFDQFQGRLDAANRRPSQGDTRKYFLERLDHKLSKAAFSERDREEFETAEAARKTLQDQGLRLLDMYLEDIAPRMLGFGPPEQSFRIKLPLKPYDIIGYIDLPGSFDGFIGAVDWKIKGGKIYEPDVSHEGWLQGTAYSAAFASNSVPCAKLRIVEPWVTMIQMYRRKRKPTWRFAQAQRTNDDYASMLDTADEVARAFEMNDFPATGLGGALCTPWFCDYYGICDARIADSEGRIF